MLHDEQEYFTCIVVTSCHIRAFFRTHQIRDIFFSRQNIFDNNSLFCILQHAEGSMSENKKNCSKPHVSLYYIIGKYLAIKGKHFETCNISSDMDGAASFKSLFVLYISLKTCMAFWIKSWQNFIQVNAILILTYLMSGFL